MFLSNWRLSLKTKEKNNFALLLLTKVTVKRVSLATGLSETGFLSEISEFVWVTVILDQSCL